MPGTQFTMRFSIVTVSFNQVRFLESTIRSILDQDYPDIEYIVVDPGSTDGSRDIIERYRDRISRIVFEPDSGAAEGLNNGFARATGDIYAFLNSDDVLLPGAISRVAEYFRSSPETDMVLGHAWVIDSDGRWLRNSYTDKFDLRAVAYGGCVICQQSTFFRASLFKKTKGFNIANAVAWDAELFLELLQATRACYYADAFLSAFRVHRDGITGGGKMRAQRRAFALAQFETIVGRPWRSSDRLIQFFYLLRKYAMEPRSIVQRLRYGSIDGRYARTRAWR